MYVMATYRFSKKAGEQTVIHLQNVSKTYHSKSGNVDAVKDVNLDIGKGEIFGIIGYSGAWEKLAYSPIKRSGAANRRNC